MNGERPGALADVRMQIILSRILRLGVALAGGVVLLGTILLLLDRRNAIVDYRVFRGEPTDLRDLAGIWRAASDLRPRGVIQLGLLVLVATPVARVSFAVAAFTLERDRLYAAVALAVLSGLLFSLFGPHF